MKSMSCKKCKSMADAYLDDALPQKARQTFEAHLAVCPECRTYYLQQKQILSLLRNSAVSPPQDFRARVMERIERESAAPNAFVQSRTVLSACAAENNKSRTAKPLPFRAIAACIAAAIVAISAAGILIHNAPELLYDANIVEDGKPHANDENPKNDQNPMAEPDPLKDTSVSAYLSEIEDTFATEVTPPVEHHGFITETASPQKTESNTCRLESERPGQIPAEPTDTAPDLQPSCSDSTVKSFRLFSDRPTADSLPYYYIDQSEGNDPNCFPPPILFDVSSENLPQEAVSEFRVIGSDQIPQSDHIVKAYGSAFFEEYDLYAILLFDAPKWLECICCDDSIAIMLSSDCRNEGKQSRYVIYLPVPKAIETLSVHYVS